MTVWNEHQYRKQEHAVQQLQGNIHFKREIDPDVQEAALEEWEAMEKEDRHETQNV